MRRTRWTCFIIWNIQLATQRALAHSPEHRASSVNQWHKRTQCIERVQILLWNRQAFITTMVTNRRFAFTAGNTSACRAAKVNSYRLDLFFWHLHCYHMQRMFSFKLCAKFGLSLSQYANDEANKDTLSSDIEEPDWHKHSPLNTFRIIWPH